MVLTVDVGNTKTEAAVWVDGQPGAPRQAPTTLDRDWGEWVAAWGVRFDEVVVASVVPAAVAAWREVAAGRGARCFVLDGGNVPGLSVTLADRAAIGPDRLANALGARAHGAGAWVSVGFGTATIVDLLGADDRFLGGAIAPGAATALRALVAGTARLPDVPLALPERTVGRDTVEAMQAGALCGHVAMVDGLVARMEAEYGAPVRCVATGGLAPLLAGACRRVDTIDPLLTLRGLHRVAELAR